MSEATAESERMDEELARHVRRAFGFEEPPRTYEEFWVEMAATYQAELGRGLAPADLCTTDRSPHWARVDGETHRYQCVTDAFLLGTYLDEPVTARTVSPVSGTELVVEFDADGVVAVPEGAQLSYGVERSVEPPDGPITPEKMYGRFCPYSEAFASRGEYEEWAAAHPGVASDVQPLDEALELQARLLDPSGRAGQTADTGNPDRESGPDCSCC